MPQYQKLANEALATLEGLGQAEESKSIELLAKVGEFAKHCEAGEEETSYLLKYAREFITVLDLTTEELVKLALQKLLDNRNPDSVISGIKQACIAEPIDKDRVTAVAISKMASEFKPTSFDDVAELCAVVDELATRSGLRKKAFVGKALMSLGKYGLMGAGAAAGVQQGYKHGFDPRNPQSLMRKLYPGSGGGGFGGGGDSRQLMDIISASGNPKLAFQAYMAQRGKGMDSSELNMMRAMGRGLARGSSPWGTGRGLNYGSYGYQ